MAFEAHQIQINTTSSCSEVINLFSNSLSQIQSTGIQLSTFETYNSTGGFTQTLDALSNSYTSIGNNGLEIGVIQVNSSGNIGIIQSFTSDTYISISGTGVYEESILINTTNGKIIENLSFNKGNFTYVSKAVFFSSRNLSSTEFLTSTLSFSSCFVTSAATDAATFDSLDYQSAGAVSLALNLVSMIVNTVTAGSGFLMNNNQLVSKNSSVTMVTNITGLIFTSINANQAGFGVLLYQEACSAFTTYENTVDMSSIIFTSFQNGLAIYIRDHNILTNSAYSFIGSLVTSSFSDFTNAQAVHVIKDLIKSLGSDYQSTFNIGQQCTFGSISALNQDSAVLLQDSFIKAPGSISSSVTIQDTTFTQIQAGPSLFVVFSNEDSSASSVVNSVSISSSSFTTLSASQNASVILYQSQIAAQSQFTSTINFASCNFNAISKGAAIAFFNSDITSSSKQFSLTNSFTNCNIEYSTTNSEALITKIDSGITNNILTDTNVLSFTNSTFNSNTGSFITSGVFVSSNTAQKIEFYSCSFYKNSGPYTNELYFTIIGSLLVQQCYWTEATNNQNRGSFIYKNIYDYSITVQSSTFSCGIFYNSTAILTFDEPSLLNMASVFKLATQQQDLTVAPNNQFSGNIYKSCNNAYKGAIFQLTNGSQIYDSGSSFSDNSALFGGAIYAENVNSIIYIDTPKSVTTNRAFYGGFLYLLQESQGYVQNADFSLFLASEGAVYYLLDRAYLSFNGSSSIKLCTAYKRSMIVSQVGSWFNVDGVSLSLNTAYVDSVFAFINEGTDITIYYNRVILTYTGRMSYITNSSASQNEVLEGGRMITIMNGNLVINNCQFYNNFIYYDTEGIFGVGANLTIIGSSFQQNQYTQYYTRLANPYLGDVNGDWVSLGDNSTMWIYNSTFNKGRGVYGGCINIQGTSQSTIVNTTFISCSALLGGGIYAVNFDSLVVQNCTFSQGVAFRGYSQNIYAEDSKLNVTLIQNVFYSYHNSIYLNDGVLLYSQANEFYPEINRVSAIPYIEYSGGLHVINIQTIQMNSDIFSNLQGYKGGAIYIYVDMNFKLNQQTLTYTINNASIANCSALVNGGAIYMENIQSMTLTNSNVTMNSANAGMGGAVYFECYESSSDQCSFTIAGCQITQNSASIGGGIRWNWNPVNYDFGSVYGNTGSLYGQDWASFPRQLVILQNENQYLQYFNKSSFQPITVTETLTQFTLTNVQSGGFIPTIYFALVDDQGQVVSSDTGALIEFLSEPVKVGAFTTEVSGVNKFFSAYGVFNVSGLYIIAAPNSSQSLQLVSENAVDLTIPINQDYLSNAYNKRPLSSYVIQVNITIRGCILGEGLNENGACFECPKGTYLLQAPTVPTQCNVCSSKAICLGGSDIGPMPGYWRKNNETNDFIQCYVTSACLQTIPVFKSYFRGMIAPDYNPVGDCATGYYGALCSACMPGYQRSGSYGCSECQAAYLIILRVGGILILMGVGIGFLINYTLSSASRKNTHSVYLKIFMNHLQLLAICAQFKFNWPAQVTSFFSIGSFIMSSQESIVQFDCFMDTRNPATINRYYFKPQYHEMRVVYQQTIIMAAVPIMVSLFVAFYWLLQLKWKRQMHHFEIKFLASMVIIFFLIHPTITTMMVNLFNCQNFDGDLRLMEDLQVICWEDLHVYMALGVALPCIVLWGLGIPAAVWFLMKKDREKLDTIAVKQKFGFMYNGYKRSDYFWEVVIMYRKIGMIGVAVFLNQVGVIVQALVILILMVFFMQINNMRRPFVNRSLNDIEDLSLFTGIITIYCAIFFISSRNPNSQSFNPNQDFYLNSTTELILFIIILFFNVAFIATWLLQFISAIRLLVKERYKSLYVAVFLCCRQDKLEKENEELAKIQKRETIIEKIEEIQFFLKNMKRMYTRQIFYEGHQKFLKMLYFIENEKGDINLTEKKHNFYIQGKMARDRKFDPERMQEILDQRELQIDTEFENLGKEEKPSRFFNRRNSLKKRKHHTLISKQASMISSLKNIAKVKRGEEEHKDSVNLSDNMHTNLSQTMGKPMVKSELILNQFKEDLNETRAFPQNESNSYILDESQRLDDSQRGLLKIGSETIKGIRRNNYFSQSVGSINKGEDEGQSKRGSATNNEDEEDLLKKKKAPPTMEQMLGRSRNAKAQLDKHKKHRVFVEDIENASMEQPSLTYQDKSSFLNNNMNQKKGDQQRKMTDPDDENRYFVRGHMGLFDTDYLYEEESAREKRLMRGLTRRLHDAGNNKPNKLGISTKTNKVGSPKKKLAGSPKRRSYGGRRASSIGSSDKGSDKSNVNLGLIGQQSHGRNSSVLSGKLNGTNNSESQEAGAKQLKSYQDKELPVSEVLRLTRQGWQWRKNFQYKGKMRSPSQKTREVIFDNFTCQVKDLVRDKVGVEQMPGEVQTSQKLGFREFESGQFQIGDHQQDLQQPQSKKRKGKKNMNLIEELFVTLNDDDEEK